MTGLFRKALPRGFRSCSIAFDLRLRLDLAQMKGWAVAVERGNDGLFPRGSLPMLYGHSSYVWDSSPYDYGGNRRK
jgi:hypothetical protein